MLLRHKTNKQTKTQSNKQWLPLQVLPTVLNWIMQLLRHGVVFVNLAGRWTTLCSSNWVCSAQQFYCNEHGWLMWEPSNCQHCHSELHVLWHFSVYHITASEPSEWLWRHIVWCRHLWAYVAPICDVINALTTYNLYCLSICSITASEIPHYLRRHIVTASDMSQCLICRSVWYVAASETSHSLRHHSGWDVTVSEIL